MANFEITRAEALAIAIAEVSDPRAREVLEHMLQQLAKPRKASGESPARKRNLMVAKQVLEQLPQGKAVTAKWVGEFCKADWKVSPTTGKVTSQHVTQVLKLLVEQGAVSRVKVGKLFTYTRL